ncbi:MAG: hypothetical protein ACK442_09825 [Novosphingobium sp.]|jgi:hypothetical protein|nr:hypothetical protein [Brevundimonas sp.]MCZ8321510.1 hypothetical protein [Novosphingobium sp.]
MSPRILSFVALTCAIALSNGANAQEIVVTGKSLKQTEADLKACLARNCPPDEDIKATLAHAENLFVNGNYNSTRQTLKSSLGRNRKHGEAHPVEVSDLLRANSRVAEHMGESRDYQLSILDMRDMLRKGFGENDFRALVAQIDVGDSRYKLGYPEEAQRIYRDVESRALAANQPRVASFARARQALLLRKTYEDKPSRFNKQKLDEVLDLLINQPLPNSQDFVLAGEVIRAKLERADGSSSGTDVLIKRFAEQGGATRPVLLYSEPLDRIDLAAGGSPGSAAPSASLRLAAIQTRGQWADIGFWIDGRGQVTEVEVLRSKGVQNWVKPVLANIRKRVYAPLKQSGDASPGFYMIERYTLTARFEDESTGTNIRRREPTPRIERMDLTPDNYEAPPGDQPATKTAT